MEIDFEFSFHKFLNTLKVYAHGRADGEQCSCAIIEALAHNLPVISHTAPSLGHMEQIGDAGRVVSDSEVYSLVMTKMIEDKNFRIGRPRQLYTGKDKTSYKDIEER